MPPFSDPPYPYNCLLNGFASTFERYQMFTPLNRVYSTGEPPYLTGVAPADGTEACPVRRNDCIGVAQKDGTGVAKSICFLQDLSIKEKLH